MSLTNRPLWLEGMFISPQHFQQQDRWTERLVVGRTASLGPYLWGIVRIAFDEEALGLGRIVMTELTAVLPDGTFLSAPNDIPLPAPREIEPGKEGRTVHVGVPLKPADGIELTDENHQRRMLARQIEVRDATNANRPAVKLTVGQPNLRVFLDGERLDEYATLAVARIRSIEPGGALILDEDFIPTCLDANASVRLMGFVAEVQRLAAARASVLSQQSGASRTQLDATGVLDQLLLGILNRVELQFQHFSRTQGLHPIVVYRGLLDVLGELSAHLTTARRPGQIPDYVHERPETVFPPMIAAIQGMLSTVTEVRAIKIPLEPKTYGIWIGAITDRSIFTGHRFVLVARSAIPVEVLQRQLPVQIKIGPVEQIRDLVNLQLPGIGIRPLPVVPRELPMLADAVYYELDRSADLWSRIPNSAAFAMHVSGNYPELYLEFWAVREQQG